MSFHLHIIKNSTWLQMDFHWYFIEFQLDFQSISIGISLIFPFEYNLKFQLDLQLTALVFHWNCYWIPTRFPMDFHLNVIEISTGFSIDPTGIPLKLLLNSNWISDGFPFEFHRNLYPIDYLWNFIEISTCFSSKFQLDFQWISI